MFYSGSKFFAVHCKTDKIIFSEKIIKQLIGSNYSTRCCSGTGA